MVRGATNKIRKESKRAKVLLKEKKKTNTKKRYTLFPENRIPPVMIGIQTPKALVWTVHNVIAA